jgi:dephospho-CoA kinase
MRFSVVIPVYNRPDEVDELLASLVASTYTEPYEVVIVEDGSSQPCDAIVARYREKLNISYYEKANSGPGDSRNFGMRKAKGDYFLIFDSDCIIPADYLSQVAFELDQQYVDCFGGPDKAHPSFTKVQKAINFAMTSALTTGGVRGGSKKNFQPRSFNMGLSKAAFEASGGFGSIHPGEDPDLVMRLWKMGYKTRLFPNASVYHKRRIDWDKFWIQVGKFGKARPILNQWHPQFVKPTYFFPALFVIGFYLSAILLIFAVDELLKLYFIYFFAVLIAAIIQTRSIIIGWLGLEAAIRQFFGYGHGFIKSWFALNILKKEPREAFPELFFKRRPKIIGLTGGIGSGKTTIANEFKKAGIPVYIADDRAKQMLDTPQVQSKIVAAFGDVLTGGAVDRGKLAAIVFNDKGKLNTLNSIVHPAVKEDFAKWVAENATKPILVREAAILFESGTYKDCDFIITVSAPVEVRIDRVVNRDGSTREQVRQRIENQWTDEQRGAMADAVIRNTDFESTRLEVEKILKKLRNI